MPGWILRLRAFIIIRKGLNLLLFTFIGKRFVIFKAVFIKNGYRLVGKSVLISNI